MEYMSYKIIYIIIKNIFLYVYFLLNPIHLCLTYIVSVRVHKQSPFDGSDFQLQIFGASADILYIYTLFYFGV